MESDTNIHVLRVPSGQNSRYDVQAKPYTKYGYTPVSPVLPGDTERRPRAGFERNPGGRGVSLVLLNASLAGRTVQMSQTRIASSNALIRHVTRHAPNRTAEN